MRSTRTSPSKDVICFGEDWYSSSVGVTKQAMRFFANRGHRVFWINPLPYRTPAIGARDARKRLIYKLRSHLRLFKRVGLGHYTICPLYVPIIENSFIEKINRVLLRAQIKLIKSIFSVVRPLYWATGYTVLFVMEQLSDDFLVYNLCDKFSSHRGISDSLKTRLEENDRRIVQRADLVLCSSEKLLRYAQSIAASGRKVWYFPHGVDFEHFHDRIGDCRTAPLEIARIRHPIIGYFGTLGAGFDERLIAYCAERRPDWSFVLIGVPGTRVQALRRYANVHLLGPKPYENIPKYGMLFDAAIMAWTRHEWLEYCSPVKTLEYLALGKPVVSVPIEEIERHYSDVVRVGHDAEGFLSCLQQELLTDCERRRSQRLEKARASSWSGRMAPVYSFLRAGKHI